MATEHEVVDDGWVLLSRNTENKHNRQPSQASMKPLKMGRKVLKYVAKQVSTNKCELPEVAAHASCERATAPVETQFEESADQKTFQQAGPSLLAQEAVEQTRRKSSLPFAEEAFGSTCVVPEHFQLSPSNSPKTAADFMEPFVTLEELPPPALDVEEDDCALSPVESDSQAYEARSIGVPFGLRCRRPSSSKTQAAVISRVARESSEDLNTKVARESSEDLNTKVAKESLEDLNMKDEMIIVSSERSKMEKEVEVSFVHVSPTPATAARRFAFEHPRTASCFLWLWFFNLVLGELATTIWWTWSIGFRGLLVISAPAALGLSFGLLTFGPEQMIAIAIAVSLAAMPALPAYSAVLLMLPTGRSWENTSSCWDVVHMPILAVLCMTFLLSAFVPAVRAERPKPGTMTYVALQALERAQKLAKGLCVLSAWLYVSVVFTTARESVHLSGGAALVEPILTGRGLVLSLHGLGLMCAIARQYTVTYFGEDLLPRLVGANCAKKLTPRALVMHHGLKFLTKVPQLRRYTPPVMVVALVVAVRRTAPILFPVLAILPQLAHPDSSRGWPTLALILALTVLAILAIGAAHEQRTLPSSSLRRLPLLLPSGVAPCTRKLLGYALVAAEGVERARGGISSIQTQMKRIISTADNPSGG